MLSIDIGDFQLRIRPVSVWFEEPGGPYLEWIDVQVKVTDSGIQAEGQWRVMPGELLQFQQQIQSMQVQLQPGQKAELSSAESGFKLVLQMLGRGTILGDWYFQPDPPGGAYIVGRCGFDQSYLGDFIRGIESLRSFAKTNDTGNKQGFTF
jgi:hypothetical protein